MTIDCERAARLAWAAGLFEGEGTIAAKRGKGMAHRYQAAVIMTDEDVVRQFAEVVGIGRVYGPFQPKDTPKGTRPKPVWRWTNTKNAEIEELFDLIGDWLGRRRRTRFEEAITDIKAHPAETYFHKLSTEQHAEIRRRFAEGGVTQTALGTEFGVTQSMVYVIVHGRSTRSGRKAKSVGAVGVAA